jgi:hypothetical protein
MTRDAAEVVPASGHANEALAEAARIAAPELDRG